MAPAPAVHPDCLEVLPRDNYPEPVIPLSPVWKELDAATLRGTPLTPRSASAGEENLRTEEANVCYPGVTHPGHHYRRYRRDRKLNRGEQGVRVGLIPARRAVSNRHLS